MAGRDVSVDLARVLCLLTVAAIHTAMVGIGGQGDVPGLSNPLTGLWFFGVGSWVGQVMPLFFLLGGFAAYTVMSRRIDVPVGAEGGESFAGHLRRRTLRLGFPAAVFYVLLAVVTAASLAAGLPAALADPALRGAGDPLWFLAAFLICQGFVRAQHRLVATGGPLRLWTVCVVMVLGIVCVDGVRLFAVERGALGGGDLGVIGSTGTPADAIGLLNMWLLWPLMQLIGMVLAHGSLDRVRPWGWVGAAVGGFAATGALAMWTPYPQDMLMNLNPPTLPLLTIGITHLALFRLLRPALTAAAATRPVQGLMALVAPRAIHLYLWHMTVIILLNALIWSAGIAPEPGGSTWWWTRVPVFLLAVVITLGATWRLTALETVRPVGRLGRWETPVGWIALYLAAAPNLLVAQEGLTIVTVWVGALGMAAAAVLAAAPWARGRAVSRRHDQGRQTTGERRTRR